MSIRLMTEAWKSNVPTGSKIVLLALCDNSNDQGECYPSISMLAEKCSMSERSVFNHITELEKIGAVVRKNRSGRSTVYMLDPCKFGQIVGQSHYVYRIEDVESGEFYIGLRSCQGEAKKDGYMGSGAWFNERISDGKALRKIVIETFTDRESAAKKERELVATSIDSPLCMNKRTPANFAPCKDFTLQRLHPTPAKSAPPPLQPFHPTPADSAPITINEPSIEPSSNHKYSSAIAKPEDVAQSVWADFQQLRKAKRAPITATALDGIKREAEKAGISLDGALAICCERGWTGFKADWLENAQQPKRTVQAESFAERDARVKANRMAEFAPNVAARHSTVFTTFDLEADHVAIASH